MKRRIRKYFRRARRSVCRYIVSFDRCPVDYRKNYKQRFHNAVTGIVVAFCTIFIMAHFFLMA